MSSPAEEAQVREATRRIIQGLDLETTKEKQIVEMVEAQLGILLGDDEALMRCLQEEIEKFLLDDTAKTSPGKTKGITPKSQAGKRRRSLVKFEDDDDNEDPDDGDWDHTQEDEDEDFDEDDAAPKKQKRQNVFEKGAEEGGAAVMGALETLGKATHIGVAWEGLTKGFEGWKTPDDVFAKLQER